MSDESSTDDSLVASTGQRSLSPPPSSGGLSGLVTACINATPHMAAVWLVGVPMAREIPAMLKHAATTGQWVPAAIVTALVAAVAAPTSLRDVASIVKAAKGLRK